MKSSRNAAATKNTSFTPRFSAVITRATEVKPFQRFSAGSRKPLKRFAAQEPSLTTSLKRGVNKNRP